MGSKQGTTTQTVSIPPQVLARYEAVNTRAQDVAAQPFQQYSSDPNSFVAPINSQQTSAINNINNAVNMAQPAYNAALGSTYGAMNKLSSMSGIAQPAYDAAMAGTMATYGGYTPQGYASGVNAYMSPYLQNAMNTTAAQMNNTNQQQQQQLAGNAISQGAFGGDRYGVSKANLINQQNLAEGQTLGQMAQSGYQNAAQNYMTGLGQQGALSAQLGSLGSGAQNAAMAGQNAVLSGANQMASIGSAAQNAALSGAQAQLGAGTLQQQTSQAGDTALYNQFLQQQSYPFQVAQFLANIAEGTGSLSGSTTTTTQPMPFFSDRRLKDNIKRVGTGDNGLPIYIFTYKDDPSKTVHLGYMADEVEKKNPDAVGLAHGYKTVDYEAASRTKKRDGGRINKDYGGGLGSYFDPTSIDRIVQSQGSIYQPMSGGKIPSGATASGLMSGHSIVPESTNQPHQLMSPGPVPRLPEPAGSSAMDMLSKGETLYKGYKNMSDSNDQNKSQNDDPFNKKKDSLN